MADYFQVKNQNIFNPPANTSLGNATNQFNDVYVQNDLVLGNVTVTGDTIIAPRVTTITYPGDDTAADTAGGQTITLTGTGFVAGANILINGRSMNGIITIGDSYETLENGDLNCDDIIAATVDTVKLIVRGEFRSNINGP